MASIDRRGTVWRARVRIRGFTPKTRSFDTRAEAEQRAARIESQLLAGEDIWTTRRHSVQHVTCVCSGKTKKAKKYRQCASWN